MKNLTFQQRRAISGVAGLLFLLAMANEYLELGFMRGNEGKFVAVTLILFVVIWLNLGPLPDEIREYSSQKGRKKQ
jgi:hypothetical protein